MPLTEDSAEDAHNRANVDVAEEQYVVNDVPPMEEDDLIFEMYYLQCLALGSYLVASKSTGNAYVIDPRRDVEFYVSRLNRTSEKHNVSLKLKGILLTHAHADFVAGNVDLSNRVNSDYKLKSDDKEACKSYFGEKVGTKVDHVTVNDNSPPLIVSDTYQIRSIETPGHTLGCITWVLEKKDEKNGNWVACKAFTGDTLFIGSVGRPDLVSAPPELNIKDPNEMRKIMAQHMYNTLKNKIFDEKNGLPNDTHVHPAHGAGSPCGANLSDAMWSTIENERKTNVAWAEAQKGEKSFVDWLVGSSKDIEQGTPQYFEACVRANMTGVENVTNAIKTIRGKFMTANEFHSAIKRAQSKESIEANGPCFIIDTREADRFNKGHIANALNFPVGPQKGTVLRKIDGNFAIWLGTLLPQKCQIFIVACDGPEEANGGCSIDDAIVRFARINYDSCISGVLQGGLNEWIDAGFQIRRINRFTLKNLDITAANETLLAEGKKAVFIDLRTKHEYENSHVTFANVENESDKEKIKNEEAINLTLSVDIFKQDKLDAAGLKHECQYVAYCSGGFRSTIASSILRYMGYEVRDVLGGYDLGLAPWVDQKKYLTNEHGLCALSQQWAVKLGFEIPSLMAQIKQ